MAIKKEIVQDDGVITNYHRILFLQTTINSHISIAVLSYITGNSRSVESGMSRPYAKAKTYECAYDENMTVEKAYEYLKTLPDFEGAENV